MNNIELIQNIKNIYEMFEDNLSKELYLDRLNWLITGDFKYMEDIVKKSHPDFPVWNGKEEKEFINILPKNKRIIFYSAGSFSERLIPYLEAQSMHIEFCDSNSEKQKEGFHGYNVMSPEELINIKDEKSIVICTTKYAKEVEEYLLNNGILKDELIDIRPYFKCGTGDDYFYEDFLKYSEKEIFIDAGCYNLATTMDFKKVCNGLEKAYAFEPDASNYENCLKRIEKEKDNLPQVTMLPYGTWSSTTELHFNSSADGCSHIGEGESVIKTASIDEIVDKNDKITFIKMDVEGAELESLKGAKETIQRDKPKLAICIYHKPEDMVTLPLYIKQLVPEYKFYLRSYSNADNEMVLYAIP